MQKEMICPITDKPIEVLCVLDCGHCFEKKEIERHVWPATRDRPDPWFCPVCSKRVAIPEGMITREDVAPRVDPSKYRKVEPVKEEPVKEEPVKEEPVKEEPVKQETVKQEPVKQEPVKQEPVRQEPIKQESRCNKLLKCYNNFENFVKELYVTGPYAQIIKESAVSIARASTSHCNWYSRWDDGIIFRSMLSHGVHARIIHYEVCCFVQNVIYDFRRKNLESIDDTDDLLIERMFMRLSLESIKMNIIEQIDYINKRLDKEFVKKPDA